MYEIITKVPFCSVGKDGRLKLHEAMKILIDCCQFQEYQETGLRKALDDNGMTVFLASVQLDIIRMPEFRENIRTQVKIYGCKSFCGLRRLTVHDEKNNLCMIANAVGVFFSLKEKKAVRVSPEMFDITFDEPEPMNCLSGKIAVPTTGSAGKPVRSGQNMDYIACSSVIVTPSMLDINGHMNSAEYIACAADFLPEGFSYNRVRIEYKQQALCNCRIQPVLYLCGKRMVMDLLAENGNSYAVVEFTTADEINGYA